MPLEPQGGEAMFLRKLLSWLKAHCAGRESDTFYTKEEALENLERLWSEGTPDEFWVYCKPPEGLNFAKGVNLIVGYQSPDGRLYHLEEGATKEEGERLISLLFSGNERILDSGDWSEL
jgi:hypothetical protein